MAGRQRRVAVSKLPQLALLAAGCPTPPKRSMPRSPMPAFWLPLFPACQSNNRNTRRAPPISSPCFSSILSLVNGVRCRASPWHVCRGWLLRTTRQARRPCVPAWCCCCCARLCTLEPPAFLSPARLLSIPLPLLSASLSHHTITSYWQGLVLLLFCWEYPTPCPHPTKTHPPLARPAEWLGAALKSAALLVSVQSSCVISPNMYHAGV